MIVLNRPEPSAATGMEMDCTALAEQGEEDVGSEVQINREALAPNRRTVTAT
jgi:hypothetical protein